ncbi:hypothetical protein GCM10020000_35460 [Streptomyces olivoverticillatus]
MAATRAELEGYAKDASDRWKKLDDERKKKEAAKKEVEGQLEEARKLESRLQEKEQERLRQLEEDQARQAQQKWLASDAAKGLAGLGSGAATSAEGKRAVDFATAQIGKDYVWGAEGPETYDCSGLTLKAWAAAGRAIPRTSQEQWQQLPKVDVKDMRPGGPGDLLLGRQPCGDVRRRRPDRARAPARPPGDAHGGSARCRSSGWCGRGSRSVPVS